MKATITPQQLVIEALAACARAGIPVSLSNLDAAERAAETMLRSFGLVPAGGTRTPDPTKIDPGHYPDETITLSAMPRPQPAGVPPIPVGYRTGLAIVRT